jgi:hypothetical protein
MRCNSILLGYPKLGLVRIVLASLAHIYSQHSEVASENQIRLNLTVVADLALNIAKLFLVNLASRCLTGTVRTLTLENRVTNRRKASMEAQKSE